MPSPEREDWLAQYFQLLAQGYSAQAPPSPALAAEQRGRRKQSPAKNLLDTFLHRAEQVLAFVEDGTVPFTNDLMAYCTPSAWLACFGILVSILLRSVRVWRREESDPVVIGPIHWDQTRSSPIHDRLPAHSIGLGGFLGRQQTAFA